MTWAAFLLTLSLSSDWSDGAEEEAEIFEVAAERPDDLSLSALMGYVKPVPHFVVNVTALPIELITEFSRAARDIFVNEQASATWNFQVSKGEGTNRLQLSVEAFGSSRDLTEQIQLDLQSVVRSLLHRATVTVIETDECLLEGDSVMGHKKRQKQVVRRRRNGLVFPVAALTLLTLVAVISVTDKFRVHFLAIGWVLVLSVVLIYLIVH